MPTIEDLREIVSGFQKDNEKTIKELLDTFRRQHEVISGLLEEMETDRAITTVDQSLLDMPISRLEGYGELGTNARFGLQKEGIISLRELTKMNAASLLRLPNFGMKSLSEVREFLKKHGLHLKR